MRHPNLLSIKPAAAHYDKIAVPTPIEGNAEELERWQKNGWEPKRLENIIRHPKLKHLFIEAEWDLDRQKNWKEKFEEAKTHIQKVNSEVQKAIDRNAHNSKEERDRAIQRAIQAAAYAETKGEIIRHLKGKVEFHYGPVEFYAAYQSRADFAALHHTEERVQQGVERVNFLIRHRLAVPDLAPDVLLE
jgi:hypothetical protein